jgi:hypothetical protein
VGAMSVSEPWEPLGTYCFCPYFCRKNLWAFIVSVRITVIGTSGLELAVFPALRTSGHVLFLHVFEP